MEQVTVREAVLRGALVIFIMLFPSTLGIGLLSLKNSIVKPEAGVLELKCQVIPVK